MTGIMKRLLLVDTVHLYKAGLFPTSKAEMAPFRSGGHQRKRTKARIAMHTVGMQLVGEPSSPSAVLTGYEMKYANGFAEVYDLMDEFDIESVESFPMESSVFV